MYIYKISLTKAYYNLKYDVTRLNYDVYKGAIIVAESRKECREIAFSELRGDETMVNLVNKRKPKNVYEFKWNNEIWKNATYTSCKKIGIPLKNIKKGIVMTDYSAG